jgi:uncharacterized paraquat-inducible protein A
MKNAIIVGVTDLASIHKKALCISCGECGNLFHILKGDKGEIIKCPLCKKEIQII